MTCIAGQRATQHVEVLARRGHTAAAGLRKDSHAADVEKGRESLGREVRGDALDHRGRAVHRRRKADEVARADAGVCAHKAMNVVRSASGT